MPGIIQFSLVEFGGLAVMQLLVLVGIVGGVATFVDSIIGMGFGVLSTSMLLTVGIYPAVASATVHVSKIATGCMSGGSHLWFGNVKKEWLLPLAVPGAIGGAAGAYLLSSLPGTAMRPYVAAILIGMGFVILYRYIPRRFLIGGARKGELATDGAARIRPVGSHKKLFLLGFVAAFIDAIGGGGWGPITTPSLILTGHDEPHRIIGTVNVAEIFAAIAITITFFLKIGLDSLPWSMIAVLLVGGLISAPIGAYLCKRVPSKLLGVATALALIAFNLGTVVGALS